MQTVTAVGGRFRVGGGRIIMASGFGQLRIARHNSYRNSVLVSTCSAGLHVRLSVLATVTDLESWALSLLTAGAIVDAIAVADVPASFCAKAPQRRLNKTREGRWKVWVVGPGIDPAGQAFDDLRAATRRGTSLPERVFGVEACQGAGPTQEIMNQRVDGDHP